MAPYNTKYGLFLTVLGTNHGKKSQLLGLDDSFASSKPNQGEVFTNILPKTIRKRPILYYRGGGILFYLPCTEGAGEGNKGSMIVG